MADQNTWQVRATAYELLALTFRYPEQALAEAVASGEWAEAVEEVADALSVALPVKPADACAPYLGHDAEEVLHTLRIEATHLFVGAPNPAVSPFEGVWRAKDDGVQPLLFVNPHSMAVERFMKACGIGQAEGKNEPLDRVSTELEFLQWLSMVEAGMTELSEGLAAEALPGGSVAGAYDEFVEEHIRTWMPRFCDAVAAEAREPFFRTAAPILRAFIA